MRVDSVFWYGAVDLGTDNLVVWILLSGLPDDELPEWYFPVREQLSGIQGHLKAGIREWLDEMREAVQAEFEKVGWPHANRVSVGSDSSSRVQAAGGYDYFR